MSEIRCYRCKGWPCECEDGQTLIQGDCLEALPLLSNVDALITDPPYGIGESGKKNKSRGSKKIPARDYGDYNWDTETKDKEIGLAIAQAKQAVIFGGNYYDLPPTSCWLIWDKENSGDFADAELAWTNLNKAVRLKRHMWNGMIRKGNERRAHPTQKPLDVIKWAMGFTEGETVLDPFAGSGTTLVAARELGRRATGIEISEEYCRIAADRLRQRVLFGSQLEVAK